MALQDIIASWSNLPPQWISGNAAQACAQQWTGLTCGAGIITMM